MGKILKYQGWNLYDSGYFPSVVLNELFDLIQSDRLRTEENLKDHHRSNVQRFTFRSRNLVLKIPLEKNQRQWIRFTTLYRKGEAFRSIMGMEKLLTLDIPSTVPVMAAEKRENGMVTDSWLIYEFLEGESCQGREHLYDRVVGRLASMHEKGVLHGDPQIQNFVETEKNIAVIDCTPVPVRSEFQKAFEYAYLRKSSPGIEKYFGAVASTSDYRKAVKKLALDRRMAHTRRRIKRFFGISVKEG